MADLGQFPKSPLLLLQTHERPWAFAKFGC
jgi:hypothetical protein